jgi:dCMP deaminase
MESKRWNNYFMQIAKDTAKMSKDPHTKVGACIVKNKKILSVGYNGAPSKFPDEFVPMNRETDIPLISQKNTYMCHAELNAILNYRGSLSDFEDATLYVTTSPCHECSKAIAQVGITTVIYEEKYHRKNVTNAADIILGNCGIICISLEEANED